MNILIVGSGKGSWSMRGLQLGAALGARVTSAPSDADWRWADRVVLVKRAGVSFAPIARQFSVPIVWDAIDCWNQPADNQCTDRQALALLENQIRAIRPALTIGATRAMAEAVGGVYLPHHSWDGLRPLPASERVRTVGYEGNAIYLGAWKKRLEAACAHRGWTFVVNPQDLRAMDILVAFRDGPWDGWMCREWKSGVKVVNAIAAGRPLLSQASAAVREIQPPGSIMETVEQLETALDEWSSLRARVSVVEQCRRLAPDYRIEAVAASYREILQRMEASCAA